MDFRFDTKRTKARHERRRRPDVVVVVDACWWHRSHPHRVVWLSSEYRVWSEGRCQDNSTTWYTVSVREVADDIDSTRFLFEPFLFHFVYLPLSVRYGQTLGLWNANEITRCCPGSKTTEKREKEESTEKPKDRKNPCDRKCVEFSSQFRRVEDSTNRILEHPASRLRSVYIILSLPPRSGQDKSEAPAGSIDSSRHAGLSFFSLSRQP